MIKNLISGNDSGDKPFPISYRMLTFTLLFLGAIFMPPNLNAKANQALGFEGQANSEFENKNQSVSNPLNLPLSTWIGPGDLIRIKAFPDSASSISGDFPVLENGNSILPLIGSVQVMGLTINELAASLTKSYAKFLANPTLQIEPIIRISFLGGFLKPGMHKVNPMNSFSEALSSAEGTVRDDGLRLLRWERDGKVIANNLTSEVEGSKSLYSLGFKSGDQVCITILTKRDRLQVISLVLSTLLATATLVITLVVISK